MWRTLDPAEKRIYQDQAIQEAFRHKEENPDYKYQPRKPAEILRRTSKANSDNMGDISGQNIACGAAGSAVNGDYAFNFASYPAIDPQYNPDAQYDSEADAPHDNLADAQYGDPLSAQGNDWYMDMVGCADPFDYAGGTRNIDDSSAREVASSDTTVAENQEHPTGNNEDLDDSDYSSFMAMLDNALANLPVPEQLLSGGNFDF